MTVFYCLKFETPPTWRARSPYLYPSGTGWRPITASARSEVWTVFARLNTGVVGSNPTARMDVCVCLNCIYAVLCASSGLATCVDPPSKLFYWLCKKIKKLKKRPRPKRAVKAQRKKGKRTVWPNYTTGHWVPFSSPSTTRRATVDIFGPASTRASTHSLLQLSWLWFLGMNNTENTVHRLLRAYSLPREHVRQEVSQKRVV
jgi:hypothetical protein